MGTPLGVIHHDRGDLKSKNNDGDTSTLHVEETKTEGLMMMNGADRIDTADPDCSKSRRYALAAVEAEESERFQ
jgi:hypothetical protein